MNKLHAICSLLIASAMLVVCVMLGACSGRQDSYTPKPKGYFRIALPQHTYQNFDTILPFTFQYASSSFYKLNKKENGNYWIDIVYPDLNVSLKLTYLPLQNNFRELAIMEEKMVKQHQVIADDIESSLIQDSASHIFGQIYDIYGRDVATPLQFWLSDEDKHFMRGTIYFNFTPNNDSLQPVIDFLHEDVMYLINSFEWK